MSKTLVYKGRGRTFARFVRDGREISIRSLDRRLLAASDRLDELALDGADGRDDLDLVMEEWFPFMRDLALKIASAGIDCVFVDERPPADYDRRNPENSRMFSHVFRHYAWSVFGRVLERAFRETGGKFSRALMIRVRSEKAVFSYDGRPNAGKTPWRERLVFQEEKDGGSEQDGDS